MKRLLAVVLVMALAIPAFWIGNPFSPTLKASADTYRKGYAMQADQSDRTGVAPGSAFLLTLPEAERSAFEGTGNTGEKAARLLEAISGRLRLRAGRAGSAAPAGTSAVAASGDAAESASPSAASATTTGGAGLSRDGIGFTIEPTDGNVLRIRPLLPLSANTLYFFDLTASDGEVVTFAFQTRRDWGIVGTLPADQSSGVPVDTGIEVYFTHPGVTLDSRFFEISPKVDGRFETHGNAVAFVPRTPLAAGTLYKVTVKAGLPLPGTEDKLTADLVFSFETNPDESASANPDGGYLNISSAWLESRTDEKTVIPFDISLPASLLQDNKADLGVDVYRFADDAAFLAALDTRDTVPSWAWWSWSQNRIDTRGLAKTLSFTKTLDFSTDFLRYADLPDVLPAGFYLIELSAGAKDKPLKAQALLQVTDTTAWFIEDEDTLLFWVNNARTGRAEAGATVSSHLTGLAAKTDTNGLAVIDKTGSTAPKGDRTEYFRITGADGSVTIFDSGYPSVSTTGTGSSAKTRYGYGSSGEGDYWRYAGMDRTLYKPSDTVRFWGFARSRLTGVSPSEVTVEIAQGGWMMPWADSRFSCWLPMLQQPLLAATLPAANGFWDGSLDLPALDPGYYTLSVKAGDVVVATSSFSVEDYKKPAWEISVSADKNALFPGDTAVFTVKAAFFDGTPVANQTIRYTLNLPNDSITGEGKTNMKGELAVPFTAKYLDGYQGELWASFYATADLPETGEVSASAAVRPFMNRIGADVTGEMVGADGKPVTDGPIDKTKPGTGRVTVNAYNIDLTTLNDAETDNDDYHGTPVAGQVFEAVTTVTTWERVEMGETYDFVNKVVVPRYEYRERKETAATGTITTGPDGKGTFEFPIPAGSEGQYTTELRTVDRENRPMTFSTWHSSYYGYPDRGTWYNLSTDKSAYRDGEPVKAELERSDKAALSGRTLFVASWKGIQSWTVTNGTRYETVFEDTMAPNLSLDGVLFDGKAYHAAQGSIAYDSEEKRLSFDITTDRDSYRPGDTATLTIHAKDPKGNPVPATINVALVDEALLKLSDQYLDVLSSLYGWMDNGILRRAGDARRVYPSYGARNGMAIAFSESAAMPAPSAAAMDMAREMPAKATFAGGMTAAASYVVRSDFRDTAYFHTATLDATGTGTLTIDLPDNITDWRVSVSGISGALQGGVGKGSAIVSLPFFLSETLNATYLTGDEPSVGLTAYGTALGEDEAVTFNVTSPDLPSLDRTVTAKAFERVNIPLGKLPTGTWRFILKAVSASGRTDAVERTVTVVDSYREMQKTVQVPLANGMTVPAGTKGLTRLAVADPERAALLQTLYGLAWSGGHRLDQRLVAASAQRRLNELIRQGAGDGGDVSGWLFEPETVDTNTYRREDGSYGILPYAPGDLRMTALLTGMLAENGNTELLRAFYYNKLYLSDAPPAAVLYGLARLGEPVLSELSTAASIENAPAEDTLFTILGLEAVGDLPSARALWDGNITKLLEKSDPYIRLKVSADKDENLQLTALASVAAAALRLPDADGLHAYVMNNPSRNVYTGIEDLLWTTTRFGTLPVATLSFTWTWLGKATTESLANGAVAFITVPSTKAGELSISGVSGSGVVSSTFTAPMEGVGNEKAVSLTRTYYSVATGERANTFAMDDLVRIDLSWDIASDAMDSIYEISDFLPAGLTAVDNPWQYGIRPPAGFWYRSFEGQQADFTVGRDWNLNRTITYYARVTSPGTYTAEGAVMRGSTVRGSVLGIDSETIVIRAD